MGKDKSPSAPSPEKRNLGFVKVRRGLREHLHRSRMSSNASTMFMWLLLSAQHSGPRRGSVEANYDDLMRGLGWSYSMVRRTVEELTDSGYIRVSAAPNQHAVTLIRILKFDTDEDNSAVLTGEHTNNSAVLTGVLSALSTGEQSSEQSTPSIAEKSKDLQAPKNAVEVKNKRRGYVDAVRRQGDVELRPATGNGFSSKNRNQKRQQLERRLSEAILENGNEFGEELGADYREAFAYIQYTPINPHLVPAGFVYFVKEVYDHHKHQGLPSPGNMCSKIIDRLVSEQDSCKKLKFDPSEYFWPPDFQDHRDMLREKERVYERTARDAAEARA